MTVRVQRWFRSFDTAPRDGTPFAVAHVYRYNHIAEHWEALGFGDGDQLDWFPTAWRADNSPRWWCRLPPVSFAMPKWFKVRYSVRVANPSLADRFRGYLIRLAGILLRAKASAA